MRILYLLPALFLIILLNACPALADNDLHDKDNLSEADNCGACHRAHTGQQSKLLKVATGSQDQFCYVCHDGTGAETDVKNGVLNGSTYGTDGDGLKGGGFENALMDPSLTGTPASSAITSLHSVDNSLLTAWGGGDISGTPDYGNQLTLECGDCHNPHGNGNYRILRGNPDGMYNEGSSAAVDVTDEGSPTYTITYDATTHYRNTSYAPTELDEWCAQCHNRYSAGAAQGHTDSGDAVFAYRHNTQNLSGGCLKCHVVHGTTATMGTYSGGVNLPDSSAGSGADDSRLLSSNNRSVCLPCHVADGQVAGHGGGGDCSACHGSSGSHAVHTLSDSRGPATPLDCNDCHDTNDYSRFADGQELAATNACNICHSPNGGYNGVVSTSGSVGAKTNWATGIYTGNTLQSGKEKWCVGCHDSVSAIVSSTNAPDVGGNNSTYGFYYNGHGRIDASKECMDCHDTTIAHIDSEARTYSFDSAYYGPAQSGLAYQAGYRLKDVGGEVPLMIPANYNITFDYDAALMRDTAFRLCFDSGCHDSSNIFDNTPGDGINSNFKASLPDPPRNYSYAWGSGEDTNEHVSHIMNYIGPYADSDWNTGTTGAGGSSGRDTTMACSSCHNVHGTVGANGSTNEAMVRDGNMVGRTGYGFSYVIEDGAYPMVTSTGATQATSIGAIFRYGTEENASDAMCGGSMCHGDPATPPSSYDATGSSWGTYLEYYREWQDYSP